MTAPMIHETGVENLKELAAAKGPCITAVIPLPNPAESRTRIKNAIREIQKQLAERGTDPDTASSLIAPMEALAGNLATDGTWAHALVLFRSAGLFQHYLLHGQFQESHVVQERFQVRPLLQTLAHESRFHLLGLSRRHVRLFNCTQSHAEPVTLGPNIPQSLEAWMNSRQPDHVLASRSAAGPSVGSMKGVLSGMSADHEREGEYLTHFFQEVDRGLSAYLRKQNSPLVLAGVEYELAIYRRVNSYRRTLEDAVFGSPDGISDGALYERAMKIVAGTFSEPLQNAITEIREHAGTPHSSADPRTIVQAAFQGRVSDLLIAAHAEYWGAWNPQTQEVEPQNRAEELFNVSRVRNREQRRTRLRGERIGYAGQGRGGGLLPLLNLTLRRSDCPACSCCRRTSPAPRGAPAKC